MKNLQEMLRSENGATAVEYAIMAGLIAGVIVVGVTALGGALPPIFNTAAGWFGS